MSKLIFLSVCAALATLALTATAAPVINEIVFHAPGSPTENPAQEWIEIFNPDAVAAHVGGCACRVVELDVLPAIAQAARPSADQCAGVARLPRCGGVFGTQFQINPASVVYSL